MFRSWMKFSAFCLLPFSLEISAQDRSKPEDVHIEIVVRPKATEDTATLPHLDRHSFAILQQGKKLPFKLETSSGIKNLFFVAAGAFSDCSQGKFAATLSPLMSQGWKVRVADLSGQATAAFGKSSLWSTVCAQATSTSAVKLFRELEGLPGRRVLVFESPRAAELLSQSITNSTIKDALVKVPEIYLVDGGMKAESKTYLFSVHQEASPSLGEDSPINVPCHGASSDDLCNITVAKSYQKSGFGQGIMHEKRVTDAVKDLLSSSSYYDIAFQISPSGMLKTRPIELFFHTHSDVSVSIAMYAVKPAGSEKDNTRMEVTTPLVVHTGQ